MNSLLLSNNVNEKKEETSEIVITRRYANFDRLNFDIVVIILTYLSPREIVIAMPTCKIINSASRSRIVNAVALRRFDKRYTLMPIEFDSKEYNESPLIRAAVIETINNQESSAKQYRRIQRDSDCERACIYKCSFLFLAIPAVVGLSTNTKAGHYIALASAIFIVIIFCLACYKHRSHLQRAVRSEQRLTEQRQRLLTKSKLHLQANTYGAIKKPVSYRPDRDLQYFIFGP